MSNVGPGGHANLTAILAVMDPTERAAVNMAGWHATSVEALGCASHWWPGAWAARGSVPPIYLNAIVFGFERSPAEQAGRLSELFANTPPTQELVIVDATNQLDLRPLGLEREPPKPCFWRSPHMTAPPMSGDLEILEVTSHELQAEFEAISIEGFTERASPVPRFAVHAPGVLADPRFRLWLGRVDGAAVGAAMAYAGDDLIGIYGVTVVKRARRRGYGAALTWRALHVNTRLPATLSPSEMAVGMYKRLGFMPVGNASAWHRSRYDG